MGCKHRWIYLKVVFDQKLTLFDPRKYKFTYHDLALDLELSIELDSAIAQARENVFKLGPETWSGLYHILCYNHAKSAALIQFV